MAGPDSEPRAISSTDQKFCRSRRDPEHFVSPDVVVLIGKDTVSPNTLPSCIRK